MTDKEKYEALVAEIEHQKEETSIGLNEWENGEEHGRMDVINALQEKIKSMQCEPANDDLERFIYEHLWKGRMGEEITKPIYFGYDELLAVAQSIANWQKQQMMKDADDYIVDDDNTIKRFYDTGGVVGKPIIFGSTPDSINVGDHVKVIVIKEE
jgi:hypothetical protein